MDLMIIYSIILLAMLASMTVMLLGHAVYALGATFIYVQATVIGGYLMTGQFSVLLLGTMYSAVITYCFYKWNAIIRIESLRLSVPLALMFSSFISGGVYFVFASLNRIKNTVIIIDDGIGHNYNFAFVILLLLIAVLTFCVWGITHRKPSYLNFFSAKINDNNTIDKEAL